MSESVHTPYLLRAFQIDLRFFERSIPIYTYHFQDRVWLSRQIAVSGRKGNKRMARDYDVRYQFLVFKTVIDDLPASRIKQIAKDYKECIAWDLWAGTVRLNVEIQNILIFWDFLESQIVPVGISPVEREFYRRTAERLVRDGFLPRRVMQQFKKPRPVRTPPRTGQERFILSLAA